MRLGSPVVLSYLDAGFEPRRGHLLPCLLLLLAKTCCPPLAPKRWLPSWVYPVKVLHHLLGAKDELHFLASSKQQQAAAAEGPKVLVTTAWLKTGIQVAQNDRGAQVHHHKQFSLRFEPSSPFYGRFSVQKKAVFGLFLAIFRTIVLKTQDDRRYGKHVFPMRAVVLSWQLGYQRMANGCSIRRVPRRCAT